MNEERDTESATYLVRAHELHRDDVQRGEVRVRSIVVMCKGTIETRRLDLDESTVARSIGLQAEEAGSELKPRRVSELTWHGVRGNRWESAPVSTVCLYIFCAGRGNR